MCWGRPGMKPVAAPRGTRVEQVSVDMYKKGSGLKFCLGAGASSNRVAEAVLGEVLIVIQTARGLQTMLEACRS